MEAAIILAVIYLPWLQGVIGTAPFPAGQWWMVLAFAPLLLVADEGRKAAVRRRVRKEG